MSYSKQMFSFSIAQKLLFSWLIAKKVHKNKRTAFFHAKLCLRFERERYRKTHFTLHVFPADNINSAKKLSLQNRKWVLIYGIIKICCFLFFLISYFQATAVSKIFWFKHQNLKFLIDGLLLMLLAFVVTKWGVKHGNVIYKFVPDNNNIISFHYFTKSKTYMFGFSARNLSCRLYR